MDIRHIGVVNRDSYRHATKPMFIWTDKLTAQSIPIGYARLIRTLPRHFRLRPEISEAHIATYSLDRFGLDARTLDSSGLSIASPRTLPYTWLGVWFAVDAADSLVVSMTYIIFRPRSYITP